MPKQKTQNKTWDGNENEMETGKGWHKQPLLSFQTSQESCEIWWLTDRTRTSSLSKDQHRDHVFSRPFNGLLTPLPSFTLSSRQSFLPYWAHEPHVKAPFPLLTIVWPQHASRLSVPRASQTYFAVPHTWDALHRTLSSFLNVTPQRASI